MDHLSPTGRTEVAMVSEDNSSEIGILDLLVIAAERWIIFVMAPLIVGLGTYFFIAAQPSPFKSYAVVGLPPDVVTAQLAKSAADGSFGDAYSPEIRRNVQVTPAASGNRTLVELTHHDKDDVQPALTAIVQKLADSVEGGEIAWPRAVAEGLVTIVSEELELRDEVIDSLTVQLGELRQNEAPDNTALAQVAQTLNVYLQSRGQQRAALIKLQEELAQLPTEVIETAPTAPIEVSSGSALRPAIIAALGTLFFVTVVVLVQLGFSMMVADPRSRNKLNRIRRAFWLRPADNG